MVVEYDGSEFYGFQRQPGLRTVDQELEEALLRLTGEQVRVTGAGRTDAGVHALGQVVCFDTGASIPPVRFGQALNTCLPPDLRVIRSDEVPSDFHPRYHARSKTYRYLLYRSSSGYTFCRRYAHLHTGRLNLEVMREAARCLRGEHDFRGFMASGSQVQNTVRTVYEFTVAESFPWMTFEVTANGFLYHMVRNLVGTLIEIGREAMPLEHLPAIIQSGERSKAGPTAPAQGLYLVRVEY